MSAPPLSCTVRDCVRPLERRDRVFVCEAGHSYDVARSGYVNLLQPQDRRSRRAGDSRDATAARSRLFAKGIGRDILDAIATRAAGLDVGHAPVVVDLGSGTGDLLGALATRREMLAIGIDLSADAAEHAARRFPSATWVVANADRRLPLLDASVELIVSAHGRRNALECARVLRRDGSLLVSVPAPDDLQELRAAIKGPVEERDRSVALLEELQAFTLVERATHRERHRLDRESLVDLLLATYRGARRSQAARVETLDAMDVTLASEVFLFAYRG